MTPKTFSRTFEIDRPGPMGDLTSSQMSTLTRRLRAEAKKESLSLGDTTVVSSEGRIGGTFKVTVSAPVVDTETPEPPTGDDGDATSTEE